MAKITDYWHSVTFVQPEAFFLLIIPVLFFIWTLWRNKKRFPALTLSSSSGLAQNRAPIRGIARQYLFILRLLALSFIILAMARPQSSHKQENITTEGIDIVLALDVSGSMLAQDFKPNRLEAAKNVSIDFVSGRPNDRIGFVVFAGESFTQCPITTDHTVLKNLIQKVKDGKIQDGTAIGMGLATSVARLKDHDSKSKVIILLTDGVNNTGFIDPLTATETATAFGIRVYTIGVGTRGVAPYPVQIGNRTVMQNMEVEIDEELLQKIAAATGGKYFRATDNKGLTKIMEEIDQMEKSRIEITSIKRKSEEFYPLVLLALGLFISELLLKYLLVRSLP